MRLTLIAAAVAASFAAAPLAHAGFVIIGADKDNTIFDEGATSNGAGQHLFAGMTAGSRLRRGLLAFDIAAVVPSGATITDVALTLHMSRSISGNFDVAMHRVLSDWGESTSDAPNEEGTGAPAEPGDATWNFAFFPTDAWTAGGDINATASAVQSIGSIGFYTWSSDQLIADVQSFLDGPGDNFGWSLLGDEQNLASAKRFDTRENPDVGLRPELFVTFVTPTPGALPLLAIGLLAGRRRRR